MADKTPSRRKDDASRPPDAKDAEARRRFAEGIARAEFGRFYWSDKAEKALRETRSKKPKT